MQPYIFVSFRYLLWLLVQLFKGVSVKEILFVSNIKFCLKKVLFSLKSTELSQLCYLFDKHCCKARKMLILINSSQFIPILVAGQQNVSGTIFYYISVLILPNFSLNGKSSSDISLPCFDIFEMKHQVFLFWKYCLPLNGLISYSILYCKNIPEK